MIWERRTLWWGSSVTFPRLSEFLFGQFLSIGNSFWQLFFNDFSLLQPNPWPLPSLIGLPSAQRALHLPHAMEGPAHLRQPGWWTAPFQPCPQFPWSLNSLPSPCEQNKERATSPIVGFVAWTFWGVCLASSRPRLSGINSWVSCSRGLASKLKLLLPCHEVLSFEFQIHHIAFMGIL